MTRIAQWLSYHSYGNRPKWNKLISTLTSNKCEFNSEISKSGCDTDYMDACVILLEPLNQPTGLYNIHKNCNVCNKDSGMS